MLRENLHFEDFGYAEDMLAARDDQLCLYNIFYRVERQVLGALLGLNRIYLPDPGFKSMDEIISRRSPRQTFQYASSRHSICLQQKAFTNCIPS